MNEAKMQSYDYAHCQGVKVISWDKFAALAARLAEELDRVGTEIVVGIARAGLFPATAAACSLRRELYPVRVTRRINDQIVHKSPVWKAFSGWRQSTLEEAGCTK